MQNIGIQAYRVGANILRFVTPVAAIVDNVMTENVVKRVQGQP